MLLLTLFLTSVIANATPAPPSVVSLKGEVQVLTRTGDGLPSMLYEGKKYFYRKARIGMQVPEGATVLCSPDARTKLVYPSGTSLWLGQGTMMTVVRAEQAPVGENSSLELVYGKVRALVTKSKDAKWHVKTPSAVNGVRGTDFVSSYSATSGNQVTVISGVVEVKPAEKKAQVKEVKPDETAVETPEGQVKVEPVSKVQVLSAYEMTVIAPPLKKEEPKEVEVLETKSKTLLAAELKPEETKAAEGASEAELNRKLIESHLQNAKASSETAEPFSHDLDNYKKMDEGR